MTDSLCDVGLVGLGVMGKNFALNMADKGVRVGVYNRTTEKTRRFIREEVNGRPITPGYSIKEFADTLKSPKTVLIFVPAGDAVDEVIGELPDVIGPGDLVVDCGNSHFKDTDRREERLREKGILFLGMGVSGGESGARHGPSLMPGGSEEGYTRIRSILEASAARVNGEPCVAYLGPRSAGHYVKMVHNGIEYGIMQLIAETYDLLSRGLGFDAERLSSIYEKWNRGELQGYLIEITAQVLARKDDRTGRPLVDMIMDRARQKGTGKWASMDAMELQNPVPTIDAAVTMRNLSDYQADRYKASEVLQGPSRTSSAHPESLPDGLEKGLFAAVLLTYAQGMSLLRQASLRYEYGLDMEAVARIWRGGCIIRAGVLEDIREAFRAQPGLDNMVLSPHVVEKLSACQQDLRGVVWAGIELGIPVPGHMSALAYYDAYRSLRLPANLIMAQRDYFGAHRYERIDDEGTFHTEWNS